MDRPFKEGDVVYAEGTSAIIGDVLDVEDPEDADGAYQYVKVRWRSVVTTEDSEDLHLATDVDAATAARGRVEEIMPGLLALAITSGWPDYRTDLELLLAEYGTHGSKVPA